MSGIWSGGKRGCRALHGRRRFSIALLIVVAGAARVLAQCVEQEKLIASDAAQDDAFGYVVSLSGVTAVVGAMYADCADGRDCGAVYVYRLVALRWVEQQRLTASDAQAFDRFGSAISVSGDLIVVGSPSEDCGIDDHCGAAYVFRFDGTSWVEEQKVTPPDRGQGDFFGVAVAVSGETIIVGASLDFCLTGNDRSCGSVYAFRFNGIDWDVVQKLFPPDGDRGDQFGGSLAVDGDVLLVGARHDECLDGSPVCGSVYVFRFDGSNWVEQQKLKAADAAAGDFFGESVSASGDMVIIGAHGVDCASGENFCGAAYVFRNSGSTWVEHQKLTARDPDEYDSFGVTVSVSGEKAMVGAPGDDCEVGSACGSAYFYRYDGTNWIEEQQLTASDETLGAYFGQSVSLAASTGVVGAFRDPCEQGGEACGAAYVMRCLRPGPVPTAPKWALTGLALLLVASGMILFRTKADSSVSA